MMAKAMVVEQAGKFSEKSFPLPVIGAHDLLLKVERVSICGSDPKMFLGNHSQVQLPVILGHEVVGFVAEVGDAAEKTYGVSVGDRIVVEPYIMCGACSYCLTGNYQLCANGKRAYGFTLSCDQEPYLWGAYSEYLYVSPGSKVHHIKPKIPANAACLASVIGNGIRWIRRKGKAQFGESVVILGPGAQGLASVIAAQEAGMENIIVVGLGRDEVGFGLAKEFGATHLVDVDKSDALEAVKHITEGRMADLAVECTGNVQSIGTGIDFLRPQGRYVLASVTGKKLASIETDKIVNKELEIYGGYGQSWDVELAVKIINSRKYAIEKIITQEYPLAQAQEAMEFFISKPANCIRVALVP